MRGLSLFCTFCRINRQYQLQSALQLQRLLPCHMNARSISVQTIRFKDEPSDSKPKDNKKKGKGKIVANKASVKEEKKVASAKADSSSSSESDSDSSSSDSDVEALDPKLVSAAKDVAKQLPNKKQAESELLGKLLSQTKTTTAQKKGEKPGKASSVNHNMKVFEGLQFDLGKKTPTYKSKRSDLDSLLGDQDEEEPVERKGKGVGLFSGTPLGIFTKKDQPQTTGKKSLLDIVAEERRREIHQMPPQNGFEEMIRWTQEGKLWTFPIDNEAGWEEEKSVKFHEHVLLERQIRDFPAKGPIRHFMELVTVTLSKNPYLTVQQKHEHIDWFRKYFDGHRDLLEAKLGVNGVIKKQQKIEKGKQT